ncbi:flippase [Methanococcoides sp. SA1]|nr:flippase [Methanococcoides sp. SA1]
MAILSKTYSRFTNLTDIKRQSLISIFWSIVLTLLGYIGTIYFTRVVGSDVLGAYFVFTAYYGICLMVLDGGFGSAAVKRISEGFDKNAFFSAYAVQYSLFTFITIIILLIFEDKFIDLSESGLFKWLLLALLLSITSISHSGVYGTGKIGIDATARGLIDIVRILVQIGAVFLGYGAAGLAGGFVAGMLVGNLLRFRYLDLRLSRFGWKHVKSLSSYSFWVYLTSGGSVIFTYADTIIIGYYLTNSDVGIYRIAMQLTAISILIPNALYSSVWPRVSKWSHNNNIEKIESIFSQTFTYSLILAVPLFFGGFILSNKLLSLIYAPEYAKGSFVFVIFLLMQIFKIAQMSCNNFLNAMGFPNESFKVTAVASSANIVLNIILIPLIGIEGAAIATLFTMIINAFLSKFMLSKHLKLSFETKNILNIFFSGLLMAAFIYLFDELLVIENVFELAMIIMLGAAIYFLTLLKVDKKIHAEVKELFLHIGLPWIKWI